MDQLAVAALIDETVKKTNIVILFFYTTEITNCCLFTALGKIKLKKNEGKKGVKLAPVIGRGQTIKINLVFNSVDAVARRLTEV